MAPYPAATPAPIPQATYNAFSAHYTTVAPLTTSFTPPAACATNLPTIFAGTCLFPGSCSAYQDYDWYSSAFARQNPVFVTTDWQQIGALSCYPDGYSAWNGFQYSPAVGCPVGYGTLTAYSAPSEANYVAICCPAGYSRISYYSHYSNYWCIRYMSRGDIGVLIAGGAVSDTDTYWDIISTIKTSTFSTFPNGQSSLELAAIGLEMHIPRSLITGFPKISAVPSPVSTAITTTKKPGPEDNWSTYDGKPHLFKLSFPVTIVVMICFALAGCCLAACCCTLCCSSSSSSSGGGNLGYSMPRTPNRPYIPPPAPVPVSQPQTTQIQLPEPPQSIPRRETSLSSPDDIIGEPAESWSPLCSHKLEIGCDRSVFRACCQCDDKRKRSMQRHERVKAYCTKCSAHWLSVPVYKYPNGLDIQACKHKRESCCTKPAGSKCCGCPGGLRLLFKTNAHEAKPREERVASFCSGCQPYWLKKPPNAVPDWWDPKPCIHRSSIRCTRPPSLPNCCTCEDEKKRPERLHLTKRLNTYCGECLSYWSAKSLNDLPNWWQVQDEDKSSHSLILHAKLEIVDNERTGDFTWLTKRKLRRSRYNTLPDRRGTLDGIKEWGPTYGSPILIVKSANIGRRPSVTSAKDKRILRELEEKQEEEKSRERRRSTKLERRREELRRTGRLKSPSRSNGEKAETFSDPNWHSQNGEIESHTGSNNGKAEVFSDPRWHPLEKEPVDANEKKEEAPNNDTTRGNMMDQGPTWGKPKLEVPEDPVASSLSTLSTEDCSIVSISESVGTAITSPPESISNSSASEGGHKRGWDRGLQRGAPKFDPLTL